MAERTKQRPVRPHRPPAAAVWMPVYLVAAALCAYLVVSFAEVSLGYAVAAVIGAVLLFVVFHSANLSAAVLVVVAVPFMRPFILGERYSSIGDGLCILAFLLAAMADIRAKEDRGEIRSLRSLMFWTAALWFWLLVLVTIQTTWNLSDTLRGVLNVPIAVGCAAYVLRSQQRRTWIVRGILALCMVSAGSFVATFLLWEATGFGSGLLTTIPISYKTVQVPVYFPMTPTLSSHAYGGITWPRFLGLGREPGIGAMLLGWAFFMLPRAGWTKYRWRLLAAVGIAGTQSTAGFGVLIMVTAVSVMIIYGGPVSFHIGLRQLLGVGAVAGAVYLALYAPVFGVTAKETINAVSVTDRRTATISGAHAILAPFGDATRAASAGGGSSINLVAGIATIGLVGFLLSVAIFTVPLLCSRVLLVAFAPVAVLFLTVLASQPFTDSAGIYLLVGVACCAVRQSEVRLSVT